LALLHIQIVYNNITSKNSPDLQTDWGFAAFVDYDGKRILFDTDNDGDILLKNIKI